MELTKQNLIGAGGKLWEKENIERIYLNDKVTSAMGFKVTESISGVGAKIKPLKKAKLWFDCNTKTLHSDKGLIRSALNSFGYKCSK